MESGVSDINDVNVSKSKKAYLLNNIECEEYLYPVQNDSNDLCFLYRTTKFHKLMDKPSVSH